MSGQRVLSRKQRQKMQSSSYRQLLVSRGWTYERVDGGEGGESGGWESNGRGSSSRSSSGGGGGGGDKREVDVEVEEVEEVEEELEDLVWSPSVIRRHRRLARVINDWLDMLPVFGYL